MVINQDVSSPTAGSAGSLTPSFEKRNVSTQVTIQDGDTIALGGAIQGRALPRAPRASRS